MIPKTSTPCKRKLWVAGGFSLAELLVVPGVVAILLAISLPGLQSTHSQAPGIVGGSNIRQMGQLVSHYIDAHSSVPALLTPVYSSNPADEQHWNTEWGVIHGYWWTNAYLLHFALEEMPDPAVLTDPGHPAADMTERLARVGVASPDYALAETLLCKARVPGSPNPARPVPVADSDARASAVSILQGVSEADPRV
ncbi:MAG: hypothetical protein KJZ65_09025 [Phycisphaerales bacterium]|nr:hypothetical protein [Phycisphaerales bacterium]